MRRLLISLCLVSVGCVHYLPVRVSSQVTAAADSELVLARPQADVLTAIETLLQARGFSLVNRVEASPTVAYYIFKGERQQVNVVKGYIGEYGGSVHSEHYGIGSWLAARLENANDGVRVFLLGKPTINGTEVCSDADSRLLEAKYWCRDTRLQEGASEWSLVSGREEAETVKGVMLELKEKMK